MERRLSKSMAGFVLSLGLIVLTVIPGHTQETKTLEFPNRPINFIVPWSPGTSADIAFRALGREAEKHFRQPVVVANKAGGGGSIGTAAIATAKPDGYTVGQCAGAQTLFVISFLEKVPYHPLKDFKYIMQFATLNPGVVVKNDSPFKSFKDLIAYARQNPKKLSFGTNAPNSIGSLLMEQIARKEGVQFAHIPFKGATEYQAALLGNHIQFTVGDFQFPLVESKETRILVFLGETHPDEYPQVPLLKDLGYDIPWPMFLAIFGPRGIPDETVKKLEEIFTKTAREPAFTNFMKDQHYSVFYRNSQQLTDYVSRNYDIYEKMLKELGLVK
jgi:tripartite-type tricarboxylate transporter receptor subunit TctC